MSRVTFTHLDRGVTEIRVVLDSAQDKARFMLSSDEHLDNAHCERWLYKTHLDQAVKEDAKIILNGDLMCLMQGRYDRRSDRTNLDPLFQGNDYLDAVARFVVDFLEPYADRIVMIGRGNHETAILKHCQTDMIERVVAALNDRCGSKILSAGYGGWVLFRMNRGQQRKTIRMFRHHGAGGASPRTKGVLQIDTMSAWLPDADLVWTGHTHTEWVVPKARQRITDTGFLYYDECLHFKTPGYKPGLKDNFEGWETEKMFSPTTMGCAMLELGYDARRENGRTRARFTKEIGRLT